MDRPPLDMPSPTLTQQELLYRLAWFVRVRWAMAGLSLALLPGSALFGIRFFLRDEPTLLPALIVVASIFAYNMAFLLLHLKVTRGSPRNAHVRAMALGQIACDLLAVCLLVHFTGGVENFFLLLVLLPIVIATELLDRPWALAVAGAAAIGVHLLAWLELGGVIEHVRLFWPGRGTHLVFHSDPWYVLEYTTAVTITIFITVAIASSITARLRHREEQLERAYELLRQADEHKSFFMRKAGHEMRAPLAAIFSILDALGEVCPNLPAEHVRLMDRGRQRLRALMAMVDDLRRYSRLRAQDQLLSPAAVALAELVTATVDLFRAQAKDAGIELSCRVEPVEATGDEELLRDLVTNLVANAIQYTPSGGRIEVTLTAPDGRAVLSVADTGIGVSAAAREHIFEDFYRAPEAKNAFPSGTGLGLASCKRNVDMHGGTIEVFARAGGGTEFRVAVPRETGTRV